MVTPTEEWDLEILLLVQEDQTRRHLKKLTKEYRALMATRAMTEGFHLMIGSISQWILLGDILQTLKIKLAKSVII